MPTIEEIPESSHSHSHSHSHSSDTQQFTSEDPSVSELSPEEERAAIAKEKAEQAALPYTWRQTLQDVTITIPLPPNTRGKDLSVSINKRSISAALKVKSAQYPDTFISGELFADVHTDESTWTVVDQKELVITLEKVNQVEWWPHVVTSAPKIDIKRIQPENSKLSDLDDDTRAMVEKMMVSV